jgi:hypothetical protein
MYTVRVEDHIAAPVDAVFNHFSDYAHFFRNGGIESSEVTVSGTEEHNGLGAFRRIVADGYIFVEEIVAFDRPNQFQYLIRELTTKRGWTVPFEHHLGQVSFAKSGDGTQLIWISTWRFTVPLIGRVAERILGPRTTRAFTALVDQAKRELETE